MDSSNEDNTTFAIEAVPKKSIEEVWKELDVLLWHRGPEQKIIHLLDQCPSVCEETDCYGFLPLHHAIDLHLSFAIVEKMVSIFPGALSIGVSSNNNSHNYYGVALGDTPLHVACKRCGSWYQQQTLQLLVTPEAARAKNTHGELPLHVYTPSESNNLDVERIRILVNAFPEGLLQKDNKGWTPLHCAIENWQTGDLPALRFMIEACPEAVKTTNVSGWSPLHFACQNCCAYIDNDDFSHGLVQMLVEASPEAAGLLNVDNHSPLHLVCRAKQPRLSTMRLLLDAAPDAAKVLDTNDATPLEILCRSDRRNACAHLYLPSVECLIDAYPEALTLRDSSGRTLLHRAVWPCPFHYDVVHVLASKCTDLLEGNNAGTSQTPLHYLCEQDFKKLRRSPRMSRRDKAKLMRILAISELAVNVRDSHGQTPLHSLCKEGRASRKEIQILLDKCPGLATLADRDGLLPLHLMAAERQPAISESASYERGFDDAFGCLLEAFPGAAHVTDGAGLTPLELAWRSNRSVTAINMLVRTDPLTSIEVLEALLRAGH